MKRIALFAAVALAVTACHDAGEPFGPTDADLTSAAISPQAGADFVPGRLLVRFKAGANAAQIAAAHGVSIERESVLRIQLLKVPEGQEWVLLNALSRNPNVEFVEPDYLYTFGEPCPTGTCIVPNDPFFGYKWDLHNDGTINTSTGDHLANTGKVDADIDWLEAYDHLGTGFNGSAVIAILDSGIRKTHQDLAGKFIGEWDFFANKADAADDYGHGTHVAGIAAGIGNDGKGVGGVAWNSNVKILSAKVCGYSGRGPFQSYGCPSSGTAEAITWAVNNGANVINLSLGGSVGSAAQQSALQNALANNVLAFCASGNDNGKVSYPAAFPECVAVGATNWSDGRASYSNFGPEVEISAPGGDGENANGYSYVLSSYYDNDASYAFMAGTSMATPQAAGLAALLYALGMTSATEVRALLKSTADDLGAAGWDSSFGDGRINAFRAVSAASGGGGDPPPANVPPAASFTYSCTGLTCSFTDTSTDSDGSVTGWSWQFGNGNSSTTRHPSHSYAAGGSYTVTLTVTDNGGATNSTSQSVTVTAPDQGGITLSATGYKVKGVQHTDLTWSGASGTNVDVFRNGTKVVTTANDGAHTDNVGAKGGGSYVYKLCEAGTSTCSNEVTVTF